MATGRLGVLQRVVRWAVAVLLGLGPVAVGADETGWAREMRAGAAARQDGNQAEAARCFRRALREADGFAANDPRRAVTRAALALSEHAAVPPRDPVRALSERARGDVVPGPHAESQAPGQRAPSLGERTPGVPAAEVAGSRDGLSPPRQAQGRYGEAEALNRRAPEMALKAQGPDRSDLAAGLDSQAGTFVAQGRYAEAEPLYRRALAIQEQSLGPGHPDLGTTLNNLAGLYSEQGRYQEAEQLNERALAIVEKALGPDHPKVATSLNNLAATYYAQGRYGAAEPLNRRALAILEKALGPEHPDVATSLNNLAGVYSAQGRSAEAESFLKRAQTITEKVLGPDHPKVAMGLNNLAACYESQGRFDEAVEFAGRAMEMMERVLPPGHPDLAVAMNNLAGTYSRLGREEEAEQLNRRALAIIEGALGPDHPNVATSLNNLAATCVALKRFDEAEQLLRRALVITEKALGPDHPNLALSLHNLAAFSVGRGQTDAALTLARRATDIYRRRARQPADPHSVADPGKEREQVREIFLQHLHLLQHASETGTMEPAAAAAEGFEVAQLAGNAAAAQAVTRMAARFGVGDDALAVLVREQQDAAVQRQTADAALVKSLAAKPERRSEALESTLRGAIARLDTRLIELDRRLQSAYPAFAELADDPQPTPAPGDFARYRKVHWLAQRWAVTVLPAPSALRALRRYAHGSSAARPFVGFGDPLLGGQADGARGGDRAALVSRGPIADPAEVRALPRLPETAEELRRMAAALGADADVVRLGSAATEAQVKGMDLSPYRSSMMALMADPEVNYYAHPLFWAPFVVVGEGGLARDSPQQ